MGIVAAQCRVFIAQNDICATRPLYYHLFFLDNRRVPARSPRPPAPRFPPALVDSASVPCPVSPIDSLSEPPSEPSRRRFRYPLAFPHRLSGVSCAVPAGSPFVFSSVFRLSSSSSQSESRREGRSVSYNAVRPMPSLRSPSRFPACWAVRIAFRGVGRRGRRGVLWKVSCETWTLPRAFLYAV